MENIIGPINIKSTPHVDLQGKPIPFEEEVIESVAKLGLDGKPLEDENGLVWEKRTIVRMRSLVDGLSVGVEDGEIDLELLKFLRSKYPELQALPELKTAGESNVLNKHLRSLIASDLQNLQFAEIRKNAVIENNNTCTRRKTAYVDVKEAQAKLTSINLADGLRPMVSYLRMYGDQYMEYDSSIKGYVLDKISSILETTRNYRPSTFIKDSMYLGKYNGDDMYDVDFIIGNDMSSDRIYDANYLASKSQRPLSLANRKYIYYKRELQSQLNVDYSRSLETAIRSLDQLTYVDTENKDKYDTAPIFDLYITNPEEVTRVFSSLLDIYTNKNLDNEYVLVEADGRDNRRYKNTALRLNARTTLTRMLRGDQFEGVFTGNRLFKRILDDKVKTVLGFGGETSKASRNLEATFEGFVGAISSKFSTDSMVEYTLSDGLMLDLFDTNADFIKYALQAKDIEEGGAKIFRYQKTKSMVRDISTRIKNILAGDSGIQAQAREILSKRNEENKAAGKEKEQSISLEDVLLEVLEKYEVDTSTINKGLIAGNKAKRLMKQEAVVTPKYHQFLSQILKGENYKFFKDIVIYSTEL
jgi:hypothetical protein